MDYIMLFLLILLVVIIPFYIIFNFKLFSPSIITCLTYSLSILLAYIGLSSWNNQTNLNNLVFVILILGLFSFSIGELFSKIKFFKKDDNSKIKKEKYNIKNIIEIDNIKFIFSIAIYIITIYLIIRDLKAIYVAYGGGHAKSITDLITFYRARSSLFSEEAVTFKKITLQLIKFCNIFSVMYIYILINNLLIKKDIKRNFKYIIPILLCFFIGFLQSGRAYIIKYVVSAFIIYFVLAGKKNKNLNKKNDFKILKKVVLALVIILPLFYFAMPLFGRTAKTEFIDYISFYFGCPVPSLNVYINSDSITNNYHFGEHTFFSIYRLLSSTGIIDFSSRRSLDFVQFGELASNVYTSFYRSYIDFSIIGVVICAVIAGFCFGKLYKFATEKNNIKYLIFYAYYSSYFVDMFRDDSFFTSFINTTTISYVLILNIVIWFFLKKYRMGEVNGD